MRRRMRGLILVFLFQESAKGTGLNLLWGEIGALTALGVGISLIAFLSINKRLD